MSSDQVNKTNVVCRRDDELVRAIIEDQPFTVEIERKLVVFLEQKDDLLDVLFPSHNRAHLSSEHETVWKHIEAVAYKYFCREELKRADKGDAVTRYRDISNAAKKARIKLKKANTRPDLSSKHLKALLEGTAGIDGATQEFVTGLYAELELGRKIDQAIQNLDQVEVTANQLADRSRRERGRPEGSSLLPEPFFSALKDVYWESVGEVPFDDERFRQFVEKFLDAVGCGDKTDNDYVAGRIKYISASGNAEAVRPTFGQPSETPNKK
jgi:hypothetical protein